MAVESVEREVKRVRIEGDIFLSEHCSGRVYPSKEGLEAVCDYCGVTLKASDEKELEFLIEAHDNEHKDFEEYLRRVAGRLEEKLAREFEELYVNVTYSTWGMELRIEVGTKFMEISEYIGEGFEEYCEEEGLSEDECSEAYEEAYREELERLNEEYAKYVAGVLTLSWASIEVEPREVCCDYDMAGMRVYVHFTTAAPWAYLSEEEFVELIAAFVAALFRMA